MIWKYIREMMKFVLQCGDGEHLWANIVQVMSGASGFVGQKSIEEKQGEEYTGDI